MPGTTAGAGIRYPLLTEAPNAESGLNVMASDIDSLVIPRFDDSTDRDAHIPAPVEGQYCDVVGSGLQRWTGSVWSAAAGAAQFVKKSATTTRTTTTTVTADPHLVATYTTGASYLATAMLLAHSASDTPDIRLSIGFSAAETVTFGAHGVAPAGTSGSGSLYACGNTDTSTSATVGSGFAAGSAVYPIFLTYNFTAANSGTTSIMWAQNNSNATGTSLLINSWLHVVQLP